MIFSAEIERKLLESAASAVAQSNPAWELEALRVVGWIRSHELSELTTESTQSRLSFSPRERGKDVLKVDDSVVLLGKAESALLQVLMRVPNTAVPKEEILNTYSPPMADRTYLLAIHNLRAKLGQDSFLVDRGRIAFLPAHVSVSSNENI